MLDNLTDTIDKLKKENARTISTKFILSSIPASLFAAISVLIPHLARKLEGWDIIWPTLVVFLLMIIVLTVSKNWQIRAKIDFAGDVEELLKKYEIKKIELEKFSKVREAGQIKLTTIDNALGCLSSALKNSLIYNMNAKVSFDKKTEIINKTRKYNLESIISYFKLLCKYIAEISISSMDPVIIKKNGIDKIKSLTRCGLVVINPSNKNKLNPIVVYDPKNEDYKSKSVFDCKKDFSGKVIERFENQIESANITDYSYYVIEDVVQYIKENEDRDEIPMISLRNKHRNQVKSIVGNVLYFRSKNDIRILGVINIDCKIKGAFKKDIYNEIQSYLRPAYRLIAAKLILLIENPEIFDTILAGGNK